MKVFATGVLSKIMISNRKAVTWDCRNCVVMSCRIFNPLHTFKIRRTLLSSGVETRADNGPKDTKHGASTTPCECDQALYWRWHWRTQEAFRIDFGGDIKQPKDLTKKIIAKWKRKLQGTQVYLYRVPACCPDCFADHSQSIYQHKRLKYGFP